MIPSASAVPLEEVRTTDNRFRITTREDVSDLAASLTAAGLINPPILLAEPPGCLIVSGFRRIRAALANEWREMPCRVLPASTETDRCVRIAIADNTSRRTLNRVEAARCFSLLAGVVPDPERMLQTAAALGLPDNPQWVDKVRKIETLPAPLQQALADDVVAFPVAMDLAERGGTDATAFVSLFRDLRPGLNIQREILTMASEIGARDGVSVEALLEEVQREAWGEKGGDDRNRSISELRRHLRKRRFPAITEAETRFRKGIGRLPLGKGMDLMAPKNFEGTHYTLQLRFETVEELERHRTSLRELAASPELERLIS